MLNEEQIAYLQLANVFGVGYNSFIKLVNYCGGVRQVFMQAEMTLAKILGTSIAKSVLNACNDYTYIEKLKEWLAAAPNRSILTLDDAIYPFLLKQIDTPPLVLYLEGNTQLLNQELKLAIVGSRNPTINGVRNARIFAKEIASQGVCIVSGLAMGVDAAAHLGSVKEIGGTIAVLGCGIDVIYPKQNAKIYQEIREHGLLISEYSLNTQPLSRNFPLRNRIVVGLAQSCLVVESRLDGGSMISARLALDYNRDVMAIPGSINEPQSKGPHKLIKDGAKLVENTNDVLQELVPIFNQFAPAKESIEVEDNQLLLLIGYQPVSIEELHEALKIDFEELCSKILELELNQQIINCGGGKYQRVISV